MVRILDSHTGGPGSNHMSIIKIKNFFTVTSMCSVWLHAIYCDTYVKRAISDAYALGGKKCIVAIKL